MLDGCQKEGLGAGKFFGVITAVVVTPVPNPMPPQPGNPPFPPIGINVEATVAYPASVPGAINVTGFDAKVEIDTPDGSAVEYGPTSMNMVSQTSGTGQPTVIKYFLFIPVYKQGHPVKVTAGWVENHTEYSSKSIP